MRESDKIITTTINKQNKIVRNGQPKKKLEFPHQNLYDSDVFIFYTSLYVCVTILKKKKNALIRFCCVSVLADVKQDLLKCIFIFMNEEVTNSTNAKS